MRAELFVKLKIGRRSTEVRERKKAHRRTERWILSQLFYSVCLHWESKAKGTGQVRDGCFHRSYILLRPTAPWRAERATTWVPKREGATW